MTTTGTSAVVLNPAELTELAAQCIKARMPLLVTGPPGIGKSDLMMQAAKAANAHLHLWHPAVWDPTNVGGMPWVENGQAYFTPFGQLRSALEATELTVVDLEDLGQATPAVQSSLMQLLLAREVNGHRLPDCVTFVATTNRRTDRAGVAGILEPVKSRFATIVELQADIQSWSQWALDHSLPAELISFLRFRPDLLSKFEPSADLVNLPSPRTWSHAAHILGCSLSPKVQAAALAGAVGDAAATEFLAFMRLYATLPSVDQILIDPMSVTLPTEPNVLYALCGALAYRASKTNFGRVAKFAQRLHKAGRSEFAVLLTRDAQRRHPEVVYTEAYIALQTSDLGQMVS